MPRRRHRPPATRYQRTHRSSPRHCQLGFESLEDRSLLAADFGDAPAPYPVTTVETGASHIVGSGLRLGDTVTSETSGAHSAQATGDTGDDGVTFASLRAGQTDALVTVVVQGGSGTLDAWIDFNGDGTWSGPGEHIFNSRSLAAGTHSLRFEVPALASSGTTFARFRLSNSTTVGIRGELATGEVEDYAVTISPPWATDASFEIEGHVGVLDGSLSNLLTGDIDNNGRIDVVSYRSTSLLWYQQASDGGFTQRTISPNQSGLSQLQLADIDGDSDLDLIAVRSSPNSVVYFRNPAGGSGTWPMVTAVTTTTSPVSSFTVGDIDTDGDLDLVSISSSADSVSTHENNGSQTFGTTQLRSGLDFVEATTLADIDRDGDLDIVVSYSGSLLYLEQGGTPTSRTWNSRTITASTSSTSQLFTLDFDNDGDIDVLTRQSGNIDWSVNDGTPSNGAWVRRQFPRPADLSAIVDIDGDGDFDFLGHENNGNTIVALVNDGQFNFATRTLFYGDGPVRTAVSDMDRDGDIDIVTSFRDDEQIAWYSNNSSVELVVGTSVASEAALTQIVVTARAARPVNVATIITVQFSGAGITSDDYLVEDDRPSTPGIQIEIPAGASTGSVLLSVLNDAVADPSESLRIELVEHVDWASLGSIERISANVSIVDDEASDFGDAPASYGISQETSGAGHAAAGSGLGATRTTELNGTASPNADADTGDDGVQLGPIRVAQSGATATVEVTGSAARLDAWIDFDSDGSFDSVGERILASWVVFPGSNIIRFNVPDDARAGTTYARFRLSSVGGLGPNGYAANGEVEDYAITIAPAGAGGAFIQHLAFTNNDRVEAGTPLDFDGDGDRDFVAVGDFGPGSARVFRNDTTAPDSEWLATTLASINSTVYTIVAGDIDNDNDVDLIAASYNLGGFYLLRNQGNGSFVLEGIAVPQIGVVELELGDLDNDGDLDIVTSTNSADGMAALVCYENRGATFVPRPLTTPQLRDANFDLADVNGDGRLDIVAASRRDQAVYWFANVSQFGFASHKIADVASTDVRATDIDGDGDLDIVSVSSTANAVAWFENSDGTFVQHVVPSRFGQPSQVRIADFNGDGQSDILAGIGDSTITWFEGDGSGGFAERLISQTVIFKQFDVADVDNDGDLDFFAVAERAISDDNVYWFENVPAIDIQPLPATVSESSSAITITAAASAPVSVDTTVDVLITGVGLTASDFISTDAEPLRPGMQILIPAGGTSGSISLQVVDDSDFEGGERWNFALSVVTAGAAVGYASPVSLIVLDNELGDYGDAPSPYPTSQLDLGPAHGVGGPQLGPTRGLQQTGIASSGAQGDATDDGVNFGPLRIGQTDASASFDVQGATGQIDVWIDWDRDGSWSGADEHVISGGQVALGTSQLFFAVPGSAAAGVTYARVRVSTTGVTGPGGLAEDGEVEDYAVTVALPRRTAGDFLPPQSASPTPLGDSADLARAATFPDLDLDGDIDIVSVSADDIVWHENVGGETYVDHQLILRRFASELTHGDLDNDGDIDLLAVASGGIYWYENDGQQNFTQRALSPSIDSAVSPVVVDLDSDGDNDIVFGGDEGLYVWLNQGSQQFVIQIISYTIDNVTSLQAVDFDRDGDIDLVTASAGDGVYRWHENTGPNGFAEHVIGSADPSAAPTVTVADLDRDGDLDVVGTSYSVSGSVIWYERSGTQFVRHSLGVSQPALNVAAGDVDGDGDIDIVVLHFDASRHLMINGGSQNFAIRQLAPSFSGSLYEGIDLVDRDNDGDLDIFVAAPAQRIGWYENVTAASLAVLPAQTEEKLAATFQVTVNTLLPLNEDSWIDVVVDGIGITSSDYVLTDDDPITPGVQIFVAAGATSGSIDLTVLDDAKFEAVESLRISLTNPRGGLGIGTVATRSVAIIDNDPGSFGDLPLPFAVTRGEVGAAHNGAGPRLGATRGNSTDGTHTALANGNNTDDGVTFGTLAVGDNTASIVVNVQGGPARLDAWIDLNRDGSFGGTHEHILASLEVVAGANQLQFAIPAGATPGATYARFRLSTAGDLGYVGVADDGEVEDYAITLLPPTLATGIFTPPVALVQGTFSPTVSTTADLDSDGDIDIIVYDYDRSLVWLDNDGQGNFTRRQLPATGNITSLHVVDLDGDGDRDILFSSSTVMWLENIAGTFTVRNIGGTLSTIGVAPFDMDGDGDLDIVSSRSGAFYFYVNGGNGTFTRLDFVNSGSHLYFTPSDLDGDGDIDLVAAAQTLTRVIWLENLGGYQFVARTIVQVSVSSSLVVSDFDGDTDQDIAYIEGSTGRLTVLVNNGIEIFLPLVVGTLQSSMYSLSAGDVDGDGRMDLLTTAAVTHTVAWYRRTAPLTFTRQVIVTDPILNDQIPAPIVSPRSVVLADIDGDGDSDVVVSSQVSTLPSSAGNVHTLRNLNPGTRPVLPGDFNRDGQVDQADFTIWDDSYGDLLSAIYERGDADGNGVVDDLDHSIWAANEGRSQGPRPALPGDYNNDNIVDAADYTTWRDLRGAILTVTFTAADGDGNGVVDAGDRAVWAANFGRTIETPASLGSAGDGPEPQPIAAIAPPTVAEGEGTAPAAHSRGATPSGVVPAVNNVESGSFTLQGSAFGRRPSPASTIRSEATDAGSPTAIDEAFALLSTHKLKWSIDHDWFDQRPKKLAKRASAKPAPSTVAAAVRFLGQ